MTGALDGRRVLIAGSPQFGQELAAELEARGGHPELAPFIRTAPAAAQPWRDAVTQLVSGGFDWVIVTSQATVRTLAALDLDIPESTRVAAVGPATARALTATGLTVSLVPAEHSARGLLADPSFAATTGRRILVPQSELAAPLLAEGLAELGHDVTALVAYRIEAVPAPPRLVERIRAGEFDALVVSSGSVGHEVQSQCAPLPETTHLIAMGPATAEATRDVGLRVDGFALDRTPAALADAVEQVLADCWSAPAASERRPAHDGEDDSA
ncbi:MAG: uroporphyrinogen III synthase [Leifsonia sp.]|nr:uroporphyrinogen III synthase [Leifsonia sp.]|tara:strand:- start:53012 stop:53821 length:810 start_codon:yes stop_codon:yes gene_type:complete